MVADDPSAIVDEQPEPMGSGVPPALDSLVLRCLRKEPNERFQNVSTSNFSSKQSPRPGSQIEGIPNNHGVGQSHGLAWPLARCSFLPCPCSTSQAAVREANLKQRL